jgi:SpoVK/Ycf46/Vps4 family AAA+-type ATPase
MAESISKLSSDFLQLARIALTGRAQDIHLLIHRATKNLKGDFPDLAEKLVLLLNESPTRSTPLRKKSESPLPVDLDSRLQLLRVEKGSLDHEIILSETLENSLKQIIGERKKVKALLKHGLHPTKSMLFTGPPGVGKTMAAKWLADQLGLPLLILDLTAVMSSFLGRTGNNIRFVLDYAKNTDCVLLLDEVDAIAKRRDDNSEVGELKRLVTVLLQEIDDWPSSGLLIAATNHSDLLDPAVWRRFEMILTFENPTAEQIASMVRILLQNDPSISQEWGKIFGIAYSGKSFSEVERLINLARKSSAINDSLLIDELKKQLFSGDLNHAKKLLLAVELITKGGFSQRQAHELTGIARETIRKKMAK